MKEKIEQAIHAAMDVSVLEVVDDSAKHAGHAGARAGGNSHFTVKVVSADFAGKSRVARHRMIYDALKTQLAEQIHALAIDAKTPDEVG